LPAPNSNLDLDNRPAEKPVPAQETWSASLYRALNLFILWATESRLRLALIAVGTLALILAIGGVLLRRLRSHAKHKQSEDDTGQDRNTISDMQPILGWLEFFDASETQEPIRTQVTRIGRQKDNDLVIRNSTVHRHHALLKQESTGAFSIMDLDTNNGVLVNGERVKSRKLSDGDTIELGEVRMRFRVV
jgi:hypothetical protein